MARLVALSTACTAAFLLAVCVDRERDREPYESIASRTSTGSRTILRQPLWEGRMTDQAFVNAMIIYKC